MGFPILKLPVVALKVLLDCMDNVELVTVSLLSRRADWFLKICGKKKVSFFNLEGCEIRDLNDIKILELFLLEIRRQGELPEWNFNLCCSISHDLHISICCSDFYVPIYIESLEDIGKFVGVRKNLKIGQSIVPIVITRENDGVEKMRTFWNSEHDGMISLLDYFKNEFNLQIFELIFEDDNPKAIRTIINHINSTQTVVRNVHIECCMPISDDDFKFILRNVAATESFYSGMELSQNFKFDGTILAKKIRISNSHWFTVQNILRSNESEEISVDDSDYTKEELRTFLREWKSGKLPRLKELQLATKVSRWDVIEGFERWEGECEKCDSWSRTAIKIIGHGDCHGGVYRNNYDGFIMSIHDN